MITEGTDSERVHALLVKFLNKRKSENELYTAGLLKMSRCVYFWEGRFEPGVDFKELVPIGRGKYVLKVYVPAEDFPEDGTFFQTVEAAFYGLIDEDYPQVHVSVRPLVELDEKEVGLNNCFFRTDTTIQHDDLRFRSRAEIAIYDELKSRNVLFFPNSAAVIGKDKAVGGKVEKREPDFLVCYRGKWGILEVNGDPFHSGPVSTAKDHERFRLFQRHGLFFVQAYDDVRCKREPAKVVDEFLRLLEQHH